MPARTFERRRTTSSSRTRDDSMDEEHVTDVTPFEKRVFPLAPADEELLAEEAAAAEAPAALLASEASVNGKCESTANGAADSVPAALLANHGSEAPRKALYASSGGETDHEDEDPEWEPKEQP